MGEEIAVGHTAMPIVTNAVLHTALNTALNKPVALSHGSHCQCPVDSLCAVTKGKGTLRNDLALDSAEAGTTSALLSTAVC